MSSIVVAGDTSGSITLQAPAVAGSRVLTLPTATGTLVDTTTISASTGSTLVGTTNGGTGAVTRTVASKLNDTVSVKDFGAVGDGVTDDTVAIQVAINVVSVTGGHLVFPSGTYRLTSSISIIKGMSISGSHPIVKSPGSSNFGGGTWLYFDHTGKGIHIKNLNGYFTDVSIREIGTWRNQPTPATSWIPNDHDFDIYVFGVADVILHDITLLNPTRGIGVYGGGGRVDIMNLRCQAFKVGIDINEVYDVVRLDQIHFWPFWRDDSNVHSYTLDNLDAIYTKRCDNPMMSNIFTIFARAGYRIGQGAAGGTSKIHLTNADFDRGIFGIYIDASVTNGCTGQFANITHQGETGSNGSIGLNVLGNNSTLSFASFDTSICWQNAIRVGGTGNVVTMSGDTKASGYDQSGLGYPAYETLASNFITFSTRPKAISNGSTGAGGKYGGAGTIITDEWRPYTPTMTTQLGSITTLGSVTADYKLVGNTVSVILNFSIITNGTGAGDIRASLPYGSAVRYSNGTGREYALSGKTLNAFINNARVEITNYDNTYPGVNGGSYSAMFSYEVVGGI